MAKIDSIVRISGGVLLNSPSVDSINEIQISPIKINRGDLFIDMNRSNEDVKIAIENGAYCILTSLTSKIDDEEIAWIGVENLEMSVIKLARFYAVEKNFKFIPLLDVQYSLIKYLHLEERAKLLENSPFKALIQIIKSRHETLFFVIKNSFIQNIDPLIKQFPIKMKPVKIFENGIFNTSFIYKNKFIKDIRLSSFFVPYLCSLMAYLDDLKIEFKVINFINFQHFYPQFVTSNMQMSDFGTTRKVIIFESNLALYKEELKYLYKRIDKNLIANFTCEKDAINKLPYIKFRYALVHGNRENFEKFMTKENTVQMKLF
ncbi:MAG: hypothetical protein JJV95_01940 [Sulfurospirillum sp.]|nr:hypothetical protein [Sulfurospirillum sp.]MBL0702732.1 hypothetical protein [Sulfurospirillum sp.]